MNNDNIFSLMRMKAWLFASIFSAAILIPALSSCRDDFFNPFGNDTSYDGEEIEVPVSLSVKPLQFEDPESRAIEYVEATPDEMKIHDFWLIEYNEVGVRIGLPRYYEESGDKALPTDLKIIVPRRDGDKYTCVMIANSNDPGLFNANNRSKFSTLDSLRTFELSTHNHEHVFDPENSKYLLMSGWTTITNDTESHHLSFELMRNVCKVNVKLTAFAKEALVYKYFQWRDVPLGKAFPHGYIKYNQSVSRDWKQHLDDDPDNKLKYDDLCKGINFYIPCNVWLPEGPKMPGNNLTKYERHEDPTHFVVVARELLGIDEEDNLIESGEQYEFCLYPSMKKDEQFDFKPNNFYKLEMAINGLPDYETNDFVNLIEYTYLPESNCYMMKRDSKEFFAVPITRINKFWNRFSENQSEIIDDDTEWVAEVIWQDSPLPIFEFTSFRRFQASKDKSRLDAKGNTYYTLKGEPVENMVPFVWDEEGNEIEYLPMCFAFRTTGSGEGNVVVGVRKKDPRGEPTDIPIEEREYLWSWHFWITDYDPVAYVYGFDWICQDVPNGQVQRFPAAGEVYDDWECIMDRNLGATNTLATRDEAEAFHNDVANGNWRSRIDDAIKMFGMYYQYGRKEPFPFPSQTVYNIKGVPISAFNGSPNMIISKPHEAAPPIPATARKASRGDDLESYNGYDPYPMRLAIKHPYKFYTCASGVKMGEMEELTPAEYDRRRFLLKATSWTGDTLGINTWMSPGIETYSGKNLLDPCPVGWAMPASNYFFGETSTDTQVDYLEPIYSPTVGMAEYYTATLLLFNTANKYQFAYFPATGSRDGTNGKGPEGNIWAVGTKQERLDPQKLYPVGLTNYLWTMNRASVSMNVTSNDFCLGKETSLGVPIRCIREFPME